MAKGINIRISADTSGLTNALKKAERSLNRSGQKMEKIGRNMFQSLTAPFAGVGVAAVKSFADVEKYENGLTSIMGSAAAAKKELELLRKEALKPGLNLQQAIKGSVRLQSVEIEADLARRALAAVGNGLALVGGGANELDGVTLALQQIGSKGKIFAEEINQINERLPQIRKAMKDAFGTSNTEELQKMGIDAKEFIEKITIELEKLPKATGGMSNAIENASQSVKQSLATIGRSIEESFDVSGKLQNFSKSLQGVATGFSNLDGRSKKVIISVAAFVAGVGPAVFVIGKLKQSIAGFLALSRSLIVGLGGMVGKIQLATKAFIAMDLATKATVIGLVAAAVAGLVLAFNHYTTSLNATARAQKSVEAVMVTAAKSIVKEKILTEKLVKTVGNSKASYEDRKAALNELNNISPEYFSKLSIEKSSVEDITKAYDGYIAQLLRAAKATAAQDKLIEIAKKRLDLQASLEEVKPTFSQQAMNAIKSGGSLLGYAANNAKTLGKNLMDANKELDEQERLLKEIIKKNEISGAKKPTAASSTPKTLKTGNTAKSIKEKIDKELAIIKEGVAVRNELLKQSRIKDEITDKEYQDNILLNTKKGLEAQLAIYQKFGKGKMSEAAKIQTKILEINKSMQRVEVPEIKTLKPLKLDIEATIKDIDKTNLELVKSELGEIERIAGSIKPLSLLDISAIPKMTAYTESLITNANSTAQAQDRINSYNNSLATMKAGIEDIVNNGMSNFAIGMGDMLGAMAAGEATFKDLGKGMLESLLGMLNQFADLAIKTGVAASGISIALKSLNPALAIAGGIALKALTKFVASRTTALANGGILTKPVFSQGFLAGEAGPEAVIPLQKLPGIAKGIQGDSSDNINIHGTVGIDFDKLLIAFEKAQRQRGRIR